MGLVSNWNDVEEIVQETRVRLWEQFKDYQPDKNFGVWACTIARYLALAYRTRRVREEAQFSDAFSETLIADIAAIPQEPKLMEEQLNQCLDRLSNHSRDCLGKYYSGQATVAQIASDEGQTPSAVYKTLTSARVFLRECIDQKMDEQ